MAEFTKNPEKQADYGRYKEAQGIFKASIEGMMKGDTGAVMRMCDDFLQNNAHSSTRDFFMEFKSEGKTLMHIAGTSGHAHVAQAVFDRLGSDQERRELCNLRDDLGFTPLMNATISESLETMKIFMKWGAEVDARNNDGACALHFASGDGSLERVKYLVEECNADVNTPSAGGTPLHWAAMHTSAGPAGLNGQVVSYLADKCANINAVNAKGATAVLAAAAGGQDESVKALVDKGCDVGAVYSGNLTLLHICAENGLLAACTAIMATDTGKKCLGFPTEDGNLPIHLAAMVGKQAIVELLLKCHTTVGTFDESLDFSDATVDSVMEDGKVRMAAWQRKHGDGQKNSDSGSSKGNSGDDVVITAAKSEADRAQAESLKGEGNDLYKQKKYHEAIALYTSAVELDGDCKAAWSNRCACYMALKDYQKALRDAEVCRRVDPSWIKACYRLASARLALGMYEDAAVAAFEGCKLDPGSTELKDLMQKCVRKGQQEVKEKQEEERKRAEQHQSR